MSYRITMLSVATILFVSVLWLVPHTPAPIYLFLQQATGQLVVFISTLLGLSAQYNAETQLFNVAGFDMRLLEECIALHYHAILTLAILLTPGQPLQRKTVALIGCNLALVFFNVMRLILLGVIGFAYPDLFNAVHDYIWQVAFAILTFFLCLAWLESPQKTKRLRYGFLLVAFGVSAAFALVFNALKIKYLTGLVWLADKIVVLTSLGEDWALRWWAITNKSSVMVRVSGEKVLYMTPVKPFTVSLWQDMLGLALFWGLCVAGVFWLWRKGRPLSITRVFLGASLGTLALAFVHLATLVILGWMLLFDPGMNLASNLLWFVRGLSVLLPVAFWWLFQQSQSNKCKKQPAAMEFAS